LTPARVVELNALGLREDSILEIELNPQGPSRAVKVMPSGVEGGYPVKEC